MEAALVLDDVHRAYRAGIAGCSARVSVLRGASLRVDAGEIVGITGDEGAGKSTLLKVAAGMLRPDRGTVSWFGSSSRLAPRPPGIAFVPAFGVHYKFLTVREALEYYATLHETALTDREPLVRETIDRIALRECADVRIARLTVGQLQRVGLAQALVTQPRLLLIDGMLADLDAAARAVVCEVFGIATARGMAIVLAERDRNRLRGIVGRVQELHDGVLRPTPPIVDRWLELAVATPGTDAERLRDRVGHAGLYGGRVRVPLADTTPEEVLAACRALHIDVRGSTVVTAAH